MTMASLLWTFCAMPVLVTVVLLTVVPPLVETRCQHHPHHPTTGAGGGGGSCNKLAGMIGALLPVPVDCSDLPCEAPSGVYLIQPGTEFPVPVYCDQETNGGGWTVIQRRNSSLMPWVDFNRVLDFYLIGFGEIDGEFWWGLDRMYQMLTQPDRQYQLRVDFAGKLYNRYHAQYERFVLEPEISRGKQNYRLFVYDFSGDAGDGMAFNANDTLFGAPDISVKARNARGGFWARQRWNTPTLNSPHYIHGSKVDLNNIRLPGFITWHSQDLQFNMLNFVEMKIRPTRKIAASQ